jgi:hypothetical protein
VQYVIHLYIGFASRIKTTSLGNMMDCLCHSEPFFDIWCSMSSMFVFVVVLEYKMLPLVHWYYIACGLFCHKIGEFWCAIIVELLPRIKVVGLKWLLGWNGYWVEMTICHISATWLPHQRHVATTSAPRGCHISAGVAATLLPHQCHVVATSFVMWLSHHQLPSHQLPCPHPSQLPTHLYKWHDKLIHDDHFRHRFWASGWV